MAATARANLELVAADRDPAPTVSVVSQEVLRWLQQPTQALEAFDLIYADPPYAAGLYGPICRALRDGEWLRPSGLLLLECSSDGVPPLEAGWQLNKQKRYGGSTVLLLQRL
jgi:16S rRNA G966 N2-methylase RsmD